MLWIGRFLAESEFVAALASLVLAELVKLPFGVCQVLIYNKSLKHHSGSVAASVGQFLSRGFVVLLRKSIHKTTT